MKFVVLGSGTTVPHPRRTSSAYWLEAGEAKILLDCSATAPSRMAACGLDWPELDSIWISHFHMDHCGGLGPLLAGTRVAEAVKHRTRPLRIFGPAGLRQVFERFDNVHNYKLTKQPFPIEIVEVEELQPFEIASGCEAVAMSTMHTEESHAIHIRHDEKTLVYSSDTGFDEKIAAFINGVDLAVLECSYLRDKGTHKHLELAEAMHLIRQARPGRAMLTHLYPLWDDVDFAAEVRKFDPACEVVEAVDGLAVEI